MNPKDLFNCFNLRYIVLFSKSLFLTIKSCSVPNSYCLWSNENRLYVKSFLNEMPSIFSCPTSNFTKSSSQYFTLADIVLPISKLALIKLLGSLQVFIRVN